jgi:branched-chain amino acid transport system permease protein
LKQELATNTYQLFETGQRLPYSFKYENVYLALVVVVFIALLVILFKYTKHGIAMRAAADDQQAALSMGISVGQIFAIAWGTAALFAGVAGLLLGDIGTGANIEMPVKGFRAFPVIILGGLDSITGAVIGGLIIGLLENYAVGYLDPWIKENVTVIVAAASTKEVISYLVLIVILMFRPYGLFGKEVIERV